MKYLITVILLLNFSFLFAQANYHKATVIDNEGQVKPGYINYREWAENPKYIEFKTSLTDNAIKFRPSDIRSFIIEDLEKYYTYKGKITLNRIIFPNLLSRIDTSTKQDVVFLKLVTTGVNVSLYSYADSIKTRYFIQDKGELPQELLYQNYYSETGGEVLTTKRYKSQLNTLVDKYLPGNTSMMEKLKQAEYSEGFEKIINLINGKRIENSRNNGAYTRYFIGASANVNTTRFDGQNDFTAGKQPTTISPKLSGGIDVFNNPNVQQFILRFELSLGYNNPTFISSSVYGSSGQLTTTYTFRQITTTLTPQVIYNLYNKDALKIYLGIGIGLNFSVYGNSKYDLSGAYSQSNAPYELTSYWTSFPFQGGIVFNKKIEVFASYTPPAPFTNYSYFSISNQSYNIGLHYLLK